MVKVCFHFLFEGKEMLEKSDWQYTVFKPSDSPAVGWVVNVSHCSSVSSATAMVTVRDEQLHKHLSAFFSLLHIGQKASMWQATSLLCFLFAADIHQIEQCLEICKM